MLLTGLAWKRLKTLRSPYIVVRNHVDIFVNVGEFLKRKCLVFMLMLVSSLYLC